MLIIIATLITIAEVFFYDYTIFFRRLHVLESTASEVSSFTGNPVLPVQCDIRDPEAVRKAVDQCQEKLGQPTVVVNNAAGNFISPTERLSPNAFKTILDIVLAGTANLTLETGKRMIRNKTGMLGRQNVVLLRHFVTSFSSQGGVFLSITTHYTYEGCGGYVVPSACAKAGVETMMKLVTSM